MEELSEVQHDEDKSCPEKIKRKFKTPAQLHGLEEFYIEHQYPTESLKASIVEKLGLTYKQVSGWFCHRRLKDKRISRGEALTPGKQDLSSGVIQDHGSVQKQDSCSSTKQGNFRVADVREVESGKLSLHEVSLNYEQKRVNDATEMDDTSSERDSGLQERFHPKKRNPPNVRTSDYQAGNGFVARRPSGYLKIKGQLENSAITAVKRQLGRYYREDGPPLGIEFDPLPPEAFGLLSKDVFNDGYRVPESFVPNFPDSQPKQNTFFPVQTRVFPPEHKPFSGFDTYSPRENSDYDDGSRNLSTIPHRHDRQGRGTNGSEEPWCSSYDNLNPKAVGRKEQLDFRPLVRHKGSVNIDSSRMVEDEELYKERRPVGELHDSARSKSRSTNEPRAGKRGREELLPGDYAMTTETQEHSQLSRPVKRCTTRMEMPSSFSEDETAETSED